MVNIMNMKIGSLILSLASVAAITLPHIAHADSGAICTSSSTGTTGRYYVADNKGNVRTLSGEVCHSSGCLPVSGSLSVVDGNVEIATRGSEEIIQGANRGLTTHSAHLVLDSGSLTGTGSAIIITSINGATPTVSATKVATVTVVPCPAESSADERIAKATVNKMIAASKK